MEPRAPHRLQGTCPGCGEQVVWLTTRAGKKMPVETDRVHSEDRQYDGEQHKSHFDVCKTRRRPLPHQGNGESLHQFECTQVARSCNLLSLTVPDMRRWNIESIQAYGKQLTDRLEAHQIISKALPGIADTELAERARKFLEGIA